MHAQKEFPQLNSQNSQIELYPTLAVNVLRTSIILLLSRNSFYFITFPQNPFSYTYFFYRISVFIRLLTLLNILKYSKYQLKMQLLLVDFIELFGILTYLTVLMIIFASRDASFKSAFYIIYFSTGFIIAFFVIIFQFRRRI